MDDKKRRRMQNRLDHALARRKMLEEQLAEANATIAVCRSEIELIDRG